MNGLFHSSIFGSKFEKIFLLSHYSCSVNVDESGKFYDNFKWRVEQRMFYVIGVKADEILKALIYCLVFMIWRIIFLRLLCHLFNTLNSFQNINLWGPLNVCFYIYMCFCVCWCNSMWCIHVWEYFYPCLPVWIWLFHFLTSDNSPLFSLLFLFL